MNFASSFVRASTFETVAREQTCELIAAELARRGHGGHRAETAVERAEGQCQRRRLAPFDVILVTFTRPNRVTDRTPASGVSGSDGSSYPSHFSSSEA
jgi:hypothetical protein